MELTIEQALLQGITAHKEGNLQEAERLYSSILESQPVHADANHNLGVIAVSVNKVKLALPFFKTALEANPKVEQFWLSYIDALIKENQFEAAKIVLDQGRKVGLVGENVDALEAQLNQITQSALPKLSEKKKSLTLKEKRKKISESKQQKKQAKSKNINDVSPSQSQINNLLEHYRNGQHDEAEKLAVSITQQFPKHEFGWKALGAVFGKTGRKSEAIDAFQTAVQLVPHDAEVHNNLGNTLQEMGRLEEAEVSFRQATALKPDYVNAHNDLGTTLQELGRLEEAETSYRQAIYFKSDYAKAYYNLGNTLKDLSRLEEAEVSYKKAIALKPDYALAHNHLGITLQDLGRLEASEASYRKAIVVKSEYAEAIFNLSVVLDYMNNVDESVLLLENVLEIDKSNQGLKAAVHLAIFRFLENNYSDSKKLLLANQKIQEKTSLKFQNQKIYQDYLLKILTHHENKSLTYIEPKLEKKLYVIGESHSMVSHGLHIQGSGGDFLCKSLLIQGCKQSDLGNDIKNQYKNKFEGIFCSLPESSEILLAIGEIDCRLDSGIIKHRNKYPEKNMYELIKITVENYLDYIFKLNSNTGHNIIIQGVPCPNIDKKYIPREKVLELIDLIREFNVVLKNKSNNLGFGFLDLYKLTDRGDGFSNTIWHIDTNHLSPEAMYEAWRIHALQLSSCK